MGLAKWLLAVVGALAFEAGFALVSKSLAGSYLKRPQLVFVIGFDYLCLTEQPLMELAVVVDELGL